MTNTVPKQRLFFALYPGAAAREALALTARILPPTVNGKYVARDNLHFTLVFLGSVTMETRQCVEQVADHVNAVPVTLQIDKIGYWRKPKVIWAGATQVPGSLLTLVEQLRAGVAGCGVEPDTRPYEAHLTLVRKVNRPVAPININEPVRIDFDHFALMESRQTPAGVRYETVASWPFATDEAS